MAIQIYPSLSDLPARDRDMLSYGVHKNLFCSIEWFQCLVENALPEGHSVRLYVAEKDSLADEKCFLFCFCDIKSRRLSSMSNFYTMEFGPIFTGGDRTRLLSDILCTIARERPRWHRIDFRLLPETEVCLASLQHALKQAGFATNRFVQYENYHTTIAGSSFDDYYAQRPSRLRNTIKRKAKRLDKQRGYHVRICPSCDEELLQDFMAVYARSWKDEERYPDFIPGLCQLAGSLSLLRLGVLYVGDQPAAGQIWLLSDHKAIIYKLAYTADFNSFSVGSILTRDIAKYVIEKDGIEEIDYGIGGEAYKKDWMDQKRNLVAIEAFNRRTIPGLLLAAKQRVGQVLKRQRPCST